MFFSAAKPNVGKGGTVHRVMGIEKMKVRKITMRRSWYVGRAPLRVKLPAPNMAQSSLSTSADFAAKKATWRLSSAEDQPTSAQSATKKAGARLLSHVIQPLACLEASIQTELQTERTSIR